MSRIIGHHGHFGIVSGGLPSGPTIFLYTVNDLEWTYLGPLFEPKPAQTPPRSPWTAHRGWNWECGSFFQLKEKSFFILGAESTYQSILPGDQLPAKAQDRPSKWQLWFSGDLRSAEDGPKMDIEVEGVLDWGCCNYASASNVDNKGRRLIWGELERGIADVRLACR
jgi:sucrose-6-phosphate hydrolase SacC (GH32 family)